MIYGRTGQEVTIVRRAVLADVEKLDGRKPDKEDLTALKLGSYLVVDDHGKNEDLASRRAHPGPLKGQRR